MKYKNEAGRIFNNLEEARIAYCMGRSSCAGCAVGKVKEDIMSCAAWIRSNEADFARIAGLTQIDEQSVESLNSNNTEAKDDGGKITPSLVPTEIIRAIAKIRMYGTEKYHDPQNWRSVSAERYHEALLRHILAAWNDVRAVDEESGMPHIWHAACNLAFIIELLGDCEKENDEKQ